MAWSTSPVSFEAFNSTLLPIDMSPMPVHVQSPYVPEPLGLIHTDPYSTAKRFIENIFKFSMNVFGIFTNIINIAIFYKIGFGDSVTVSFFGLAISDLWFLIFSFIRQVLYILHYVVGARPYVDLKFLLFITVWYGELFYDVSLIITVYTAIQKCCCVAMPFIFKNVFTSLRAGIIIMTIYMVMIVYYIPNFVSHNLSAKFDAQLNRTRLGYSYRQYRFTVLDVYDSFSRLFLPFASQAIVLFCMITLTIKLTQASKLRHEMTKDQEATAKDEDGNDKNFMNAKEVKVVQSVTLVSAIFVVCNLPDILITSFGLAYPEFNDYGDYESVRHVTIAIQDLLAVTSAAINIVVYVKFNTRYRNMLVETLRNLFGKCCDSA